MVFINMQKKDANKNNKKKIILIIKILRNTRIFQKIFVCYFYNVN